jgi:enamine deaminase RidA (YjgF/YER057c/UK114 family)
MPIIDLFAPVEGFPDTTGCAEAAVTSARLPFVAGQVAMGRDRSNDGLVGAGDIRAQTEQAVRSPGESQRS